MFGIGGSEVIVILIVALIFLGPDKLPDAARTLSKGIRELKKGSRTLQDTIENDEKIGGAIRDIKSALRGEEPAPRPKKKKKPKTLGEPVPATATTEATAEAKADEPRPADAPAAALEEAKPSVKLPDTAGEPDPDVKGEPGESREELAALIRPVEGTVPKGTSEPN